MRSLLLAPETPVPARSGLPLRVLHLARALAREADVDVVALASTPAPSNGEPFALTHVPGDWSSARTALRAVWEPCPPAQIRSRALARHVGSGNWDVVQAHELSMLRYARGRVPCVLDAADVLTAVKRTMALSDSRLAMRPWWRFEAAKARRFEATSARAASAVTVPTEADAEHFERLGARRVEVVRNGVDLTATPYASVAAGAHLIFVGYFAWRPNAEAALELAREILPRIRERVPAATLALVGASPPDALLRRAPSGIEFAGRAPEVLPHLRRARVSVMPVRAGSGSRLKVLEALAAGVPVVGTPFAVSGLELRHGVHALVGTTAADLAALAVRVIEDDQLADGLSRAGRQLVEDRYGWPVVARPLIDLHRELAERQGQR